MLAIGLAFLVKWAIDRGSGSLYAGAIITALAAPGLIQAAGVHADGLSTFSFGIAFLFIAAVRAVSGGGWGWQLWFGGLLALVGGIEISSPTAGGLVVPVLLVALGAALLLRDVGTRVPLIGPVALRDGIGDRRLDDLAEDLDDPLDLRLGDDERRPEQDRVAVDPVRHCRCPSRRARPARGRCARRSR